MPKLNDENQPSLFTPAPLPVAELNDAQRLACLRLIRTENVGPVTFRELINHYGGAEEALEALPGLALAGGSRRPINICKVGDAERELEAAHRIGARPIFTIEPGYPHRLAALDAPPPMLYIKGNADLLQKPSVAIVGARQSSAAGIKLSRLFAKALGTAGLVIVSGLARGIDGAAHEASIKTGTVAVLAGGLDNIYPPEHEDLHFSIADHGCLVTEMSCGFKPRAKDFPRRNRLISGITLGVLVVEAARRSGTLVTARFAGEQGREVFAIPGHPLDPRAEGTNQLIKTGATLVTEPDDILEALEPLTGIGQRAFKEQPVILPEPLPVPTSPTSISEKERNAVLELLGPAPIDIDAILRTTGLPVAATRAILMELDLAGRIEHHTPGLVSLVVEGEKEERPSKQ